MFDNTPNEPSKLRTRNWVEINDESCVTYNTNRQIKFKSSMLKLSLFDYSDACLHVKGAIRVQNTAAVAGNNIGKEVIFKSCAPFTGCINKINNRKVNNAKDIDVILPMYNLLEYSDIYLKTSGNLWQYYRD